MEPPQQNKWAKWRASFHEWHRWTLLDEMYALVRYLIYTAGIAAVLTVYSYLRDHPAIFWFALGGTVIPLFVATIRWYQIRQKPPQERRREGTMFSRMWILAAVLVVVIAWLPTIVSIVKARTDHPPVERKAVVAGPTVGIQGQAIASVSPAEYERVKAQVARLQQQLATFQGPPESKGDRNARLKMEFSSDLANFLPNQLSNKIVEIDSNENNISQEQAGLFVEWFQAGGWTVREIAPGQYIGRVFAPYQIGEGVTVSAQLNDARAEAIEVGLCKSGFDAHRDVRPTSTVAVYVGNLPSP
jgi:hypothetical protein